MEKWRTAQNIRPGHEWEKFEGLSQARRALEAFLADAPFQPRRPAPPDVACDRRARAACLKPSPQMSTQQGFGLAGSMNLRRR